MRILGIDPGSRLMGYAIIESKSQHVHCIMHDTLVLHGMDIAEKLSAIFYTITQAIQKYQPQEMAIETVFVQKNVQSALKLGQARGAAMTASAVQKIPIFEYAARQVKKNIVGVGSAQKEQVQHMVRMLLKLTGPVLVDSADALAIALCHSAYKNNPLTRYATMLHS